MLGRLKYQIQNDLKRNRYVYLAVSFFIVTGMIAGGKSLTILEPDAHFSFLEYCGLFRFEETGFMLLFLSCVWVQLKYFIPMVLLSLWPVFLPINMMVLMWRGVYFSALFSYLSYPFPIGEYLFVLLLCLFIFVGELLLLLRLSLAVWDMTAYQFGLRDVPRTAKDRLQSASPHFMRCTKLFAISLLIAILKSMTVSYLLQILY